MESSSVRRRTTEMIRAIILSTKDPKAVLGGILDVFQYDSILADIGWDWYENENNGLLAGVVSSFKQAENNIVLIDTKRFPPQKG